MFIGRSNLKSEAKRLRTISITEKIFRLPFVETNVWNVEPIV